MATVIVHLVGLYGIKTLIIDFTGQCLSGITEIDHQQNFLCFTPTWYDNHDYLLIHCISQLWQKEEASPKRDSPLLLLQYNSDFKFSNSCVSNSFPFKSGQKFVDTLKNMQPTRMVY